MFSGDISPHKSNIQETFYKKPHGGTARMKLRTLIMTLAVTLVCSGAFNHVQATTTDSVKLKILDPSVEANGAQGSFSVQVLVSVDAELSGGTLGFSWSDKLNWQLDSVSFGPALLAWPIKTTTPIPDANAAGMVLIGGADIVGNPFPAGPDQLYATIWFSETVGTTWNAGDEMIIDSVFVPPGGDFIFILLSTGASITPHFEGVQKVTFNDVEIVSDGSLLPKTFALAQNFPNPFNPSTKITFDVPKKAHVNLVIYNVLGQQVRTLVNKELDANSYSVTWEGNNDSGVKVASGMYFYKLISADFVKSRKMMLVK